MMENLKLYYNFFKACWRILFELKTWKPFLMRDSQRGQGLKMLRRPLDAKAKNEKTGGHKMTRENAFLYLAIESFTERGLTAQEAKEELFVTLVLAMLWYCEPIEKEIEQDTE